jgi:hypothetical protein
MSKLEEVSMSRKQLTAAKAAKKSTGKKAEGGRSASNGRAAAKVRAKGATGEEQVLALARALIPAEVLATERLLASLQCSASAVPAEGGLALAKKVVAANDELTRALLGAVK